MSKVTVLMVDTSCAKCKRKVLQAVSGLHGKSVTPPAALTKQACMDSDPAIEAVMIEDDPSMIQVLTGSRWTRRRAR